MATPRTMPWAPFVGALDAEAAIPRPLGQPLRPFAVPRLRVAALRAAYLGCRLHDAGLPLPAP